MFVRRTNHGQFLEAAVLNQNSRNTYINNNSNPNNNLINVANIDNSQINDNMRTPPRL